MTGKPAQPPAHGRRRPRQSRARQTARALREAFVQILVERGYEGVTIREVSLVAGTALGSFYDYYAGKDDLARVSLHLRSKALLVALRAATAQHAGEPLATIVAAMLDALMQAHADQPEQWAAHYLLERRFSDLAAYRKMYERFVGVWADAIACAGDWNPELPTREAARTCQTIVYGLVAHHYLRSGKAIDQLALREQAWLATTAYLNAARAA